MSPRTGRPKVENPKTLTWGLRVTPDEREDYDEVAALAGKKPGDWARDLLNAEVKRARRRAERA